MVRYFVISFLLAFFAWDAHADDALDSYCAASPIEMLDAIEGGWTMTQGAGYGVGSALPFPLPPHPPQQMNITVDAEKGVAKLKHGGEEMAMVPIFANDAGLNEIVMSTVEKKEFLSREGGCEWNALPAILGFNTYNLEAAARAEQEAARDPNRDVSRESVIIGNVGGITVTVCTSNSSIRLRNTKNSSGGWSIQTKEGGEDEDENYVRYECDTERMSLPDPLPGEMVMNILVKFQSPTKGSGILQFKGSYGPVTFFARAPLTFTR